MGTERRSSYISEDVKKMTAYHEVSARYRILSGQCLT